MAEHSIETFNFPTVDIGYFLQMLKTQFIAEMTDKQTDSEGKPIIDPKTGVQKHRIPSPMLALGKAGIGKTEGVRGVAKELDAIVKKHPELYGQGAGVGFKEMRLVNYMETDLIGIPFKNEAGMTDHATNVLFPRTKAEGGKDEEYGILLVDEFTSAQDSIQVPILQLTDSSRSVGNYHLPDGWKIVIAGNGPDDGGTFRTLPGTVISRAACFYVATDTNSWLAWAGENNVHYTIRAYIKKSGSNSLHGYMADEEAGYDRAFPCPRSWTRLSTALYDWDKTFSNPHWTTDAFEQQRGPAFLQNWVAAYIGRAAAAEFVTFTKNADKIVDPEQIMNGTATQKFDAAFTRDAGVCYLTLTRLTDALLKASEGSMDVITNLASTPFFNSMVNSIKWITEGGAPTESKAFAITDISAALSGFIAAFLQDPEFKKRCPKYEEVRNLNRQVFNF